MPHDPILILAVVLVLACTLMAVLWLVQWRRRDASLVDAGWAFGIGVGGLLALALGSGDPGRRLVVGALLAAWSLRLTIHLVRDRVMGKPEDGRYQMLRQKWGGRAQPYFFLFFQAQAILVAVFTLPFLAIARDPTPFGAPGDWCGAMLWLASFLGLAYADHTLARWRGDPAHKGQTCRGGPWRYSRHPNYFCEWLVWISYILLGLSGPWWWLVPPVPILLLLLLVFVTGIPYTEARALASRGDDYRRYQKATSPFIPWLPKRALDPPAAPAAPALPSGPIPSPTATPIHDPDRRGMP